MGTCRRKYGELTRPVWSIHRIENPSSTHLGMLQNFVGDVTNDLQFTSREVNTWREKKATAHMDLATPAPESDPFTKLATGILLPIYHKLVGQHIGSGDKWQDNTGYSYTTYSSPKIHKVGTLITTVLASLLPILTIYILNLLDTTNKRIGLTAAFTAPFALAIATFSSAKRVELFAADCDVSTLLIESLLTHLTSHRFAAVEVVFIGSALSAASAQGAASNSTSTS